MIIDGTNIRTLGMFILRGGSNDFLSFPERREPAQNNWAEHDGLDVDFSDLSFNPKKVSVQLYISAPTEALFNQRLNAFQNLHFQPGYRQIYVEEFQKTFSLRFLGFGEYLHKGGLAKSGKKSGKLTVEYMMDDPVQIFNPTPSLPQGEGASATHIQLNGVDLSQYGIIVKEVYSTVLRPASPKSTLERSFNHINGIWADVAIIRKKESKQVTIDCVMSAGTLSEFYNNYNALFGIMNSAAPIELSTPDTDRLCYYKAMSNFTKLTIFSKKVRVGFQLIFQTT